ncbi:protein containing conserved repeat domain, partial [Bacteroidales bacterium 6E]
MRNLGAIRSSSMVVGVAGSSCVWAMIFPVNTNDSTSIITMLIPWDNLKFFIIQLYNG